MKVLQIGKFYPPARGGMESHLGLLASGLARKVEMEVLVADAGDGGRVENIDGATVRRLAAWFWISSAPICPGLLPALRHARPDLIHLHWPNPPAVLAALASGQKAPMIVTYHSDIVRQRFLGMAFEPILHRFLSRAATIIATSPNYIETSPILARHRGRCRSIPYGIPLAAYAKPDPAVVEPLRKRYGDRIVLSVGRLIYYKGFDVLIRAMRKVRGRLLIVGDGPLRLSLEEEARSCGIEERVAFLGEHEATPYYHAADLFVLASTERSEAFGIVQIEAMAAGLPIVNTRIASGVPFVSPDGVTGLTVPPGDPEALSAAINRLLDNPGLRRRCGEAGRRRVCAEFALERMLNDTLKTYQEAVG